MKEQTDSQLLEAYAHQQSEAAFAELVCRYIDLVHSAAVRMVCDEHLAKDVTQAAFAALAKNAAGLTGRAVLSGWLHCTARNIAAQTVRTEVRRRNREQEAVAMNELHSNTPDASWKEIAPHLDAALSELSESDRDAVLLRYFEHRSAREIADRFSITEEAAQKRVNRAVAKLRELLLQRGLSVGSAGLAAVVSINAVHTAPAGIGLSVTKAAITAGKMLFMDNVAVAIMSTSQKIILVTAVVSATGLAIFQTHRLSETREQLRSVEQRFSLYTEQNRLVLEDNTGLKQRATLLAEENTRLRNSISELPALRAENTRLQRSLDASGKDRSNDSDNTTRQTLLSYAEDEMKHSSTNRVLLDVETMKQALALSEKQAEQIRAIRLGNIEQSVAAQMREMTGTGSGDEGLASQELLQREAADIAALLTASQKEAYDRLKQHRTANETKDYALKTAAALRKSLDLTHDQEQAVAGVLSSLGPINALAPSARTQMEDRLHQLETILNQDQMALYRKQIEDGFARAQKSAELIRSLSQP